MCTGQFELNIKLEIELNTTISNKIYFQIIFHISSFMHSVCNVYIYFVFFRCIDVSLQVQHQNNGRQFQFCVSDHSDHVIASWHY